MWLSVYYDKIIVNNIKIKFLIGVIKNMLRPAMTEIIQEGQSYYSCVIAVAKRARGIVDESEEKGEPLEGKAVDLAVRQFSNGEYIFVEDPEIIDLKNQDMS